MKREYVRPMMRGEVFAANEYVAACGDENRVYKFTCDAPRGWLYYYPTSDGKIDGVYNGSPESKKFLWAYTPCEATHEASVTNDFYDRFIDYNWNMIHDEGEGVIVWRGPKNNNGHATKNLDMTTWPTAKS